MPRPGPGMVRVMARVHVEHLRPGEWGDLPAGPRVDSLLEAGLVQEVGYRGEPAPDDPTPRRCCT